MGTTTETPLLTFEEFERLPDQPGKCELLEGELVQLPPAESKHTRLSCRIYKILDAAVAEAHAQGAATELGEVFPEMGYKLARNAYVVPDVSITHSGQTEEKYMAGAPAIAIEIVSPSNRTKHLDKKTALYFKFGAREVWRIYPGTRYAIIHSGCADQIRTEREAIVTPLLPGFALSLKEILAK